MNPFYEPYWENDCDNDSLEHFGILGMKWGIRRYQPYPKGNKAGKFLGLNRDKQIKVGSKPVSYKKGTHGEIAGQSRDQDIHFKKGQEAYRLQEGSKLSSGQKYISFDKIDHMKYISSTAGMEFGLDYKMMYDEEGKAKSGSAKSITLKLTDDLVAPSYEKTMDAFIDTMSKVKLSDVFDAPTAKYQVDKERKFLNDLKKLSVEECRDRAYQTFSATLMEDTKARKIFFDNLKSQGYNAIIDENDAQFGKGMTSPTIVFDNSSVKSTKIANIDKDDIEYFSELYWGGVSRQSQEKTRKKWEKYAGASESKFIK